MPTLAGADRVYRGSTLVYQKPVQESRFLSHFDGANGSQVVVDSRGQGYPLDGAVLSTEQSVFGGSSLKISGTAYRFELPSMGLADDAFCIDFWVRPDVFNAGRTIIDARADAGQGFLITQPSEDPTKVAVYIGPSTGYAVTIISAAGALAASTWTHVATTRDAAGTLRLFVNGVLQGSGTWAGTPSWHPSVFMVGKSIATTSQFFGYVDELRVVKGDPVWIANFSAPIAQHTS